MHTAENSCIHWMKYKIIWYLSCLLQQNVKKQSSGPTWISAQGYAGALDHFFVTASSGQQPDARVHYDVVFPTDHFPLVLHVYSLKMCEPSSKLHKGIQYQPNQQKHGMFQAVFQQAFAVHTSLCFNDITQHFTEAMLHVATTAFGTPSDAYAVPALVEKVQGKLQA